MQNDDVVAVLAREWLHPFLKREGFRKKGATWNRQVGPLIHVLSLQKGKGSTKAHGDFTVNVGVFSPVLYAHCRGKTPPAFAQDIGCAVRIRLGALVDGGILAVCGQPGKRLDHWWEYDGNSSAEGLAASVTQAIATCALPFLHKFDSIETVRDFLSLWIGRPIAMPMDFLHLAIAMALTGDSAGARLLLSQANRLSGWQEWVERIVKDLNLAL